MKKVMDAKKAACKCSSQLNTAQAKRAIEVRFTGQLGNEASQTFVLPERGGLKNLKALYRVTFDVGDESPT